MISGKLSEEQDLQTEAGSSFDLQESEVLEQLERIASSSHFRNSRRYPAMLRFVVQEMLAGRGDSLKERTLGVVVFGRKHDYDTNADPIVRVSAAEIRKRIAQYYQGPGREDTVRFELPLGTYSPLVSRVQNATQVEHTPVPFSQIQRMQPLPSRIEEASSVVETTVQGLAPQRPDRTGLAAETDERDRANLRRNVHPPLVRRQSFWIVSCNLLAFAILLLLLLRKESPLVVTPLVSASDKLGPNLAVLWAPLLRSSEPALFVLGVHSFDKAGHDISSTSHATQPQTEQSLLSAMTQSDMISISDVIAYNRLTSLLARQGHAYKTQGAEDTMLTDLGHSPVVLVGGFNNLWTLRLGASLRFRFITVNNRTNLIEDAQRPGRQWTLDTSRDALKSHRDYGIVGCFFDPQTEQPVSIVAGIGKSGTEAAADLVTSDTAASELVHNLSKGTHKNYEILLYTDVVDGSHGPPHIIDSYTW